MITTEHPILFSSAMVKAIIAGGKTVTRRIIKESFNGCLTNGGPHPCPNAPLVIYPGETMSSPDGIESMTVDWPQVRAFFNCSTLDSEAKCRQGKSGDRLWVRETWKWEGETKYTDAQPIGDFWYAADVGVLYEQGPARWKPSIHMPKEASRVWLEVEDITVEELHQITEKEAIKEGIHFDEDSGYYFAGDLAMAQTALDCFRQLWIAINGQDSWDCNPWVWRISFKVLSTTGKP